VNGDITIISFDAVSEAFDKMEAGLINVDIECNPLQGPLIAEIIERLERGERVDRVYYVEEKVFEAENAGKDGLVVAISKKSNKNHKILTKL
jgi:simple sugar transport system substrate-binding protein